ncbi:sodium-dependent glucose transporter 1-like protein [Leptotrombidium deliense]|uniref:Sodium-dependent glucose transporter 1-like protein n=1 Tax=Leptotrombidium deliense TaxID=299467 RepID=A0A443SCI3_9ACAR|nr:sodium-dependent glucose transporter 1-like protein [Leptotrombidium deliense]
MVVVKKLDVFNIIKLATTFAIFFCFLVYGIAVNLFGPTWLDLKLLVGTSMERMSFSISMRSASFSVGALIGGFMFNYLNRQVMYSILLFILGTSTVLLSLIPDYTIFLVLNCIFGAVSGAADTAVNVWLLDMWAERSAPFLQALQFCWAVGFILAPLISHPFLAEENSGMVDAHGFISAEQLNETEIIAENSNGTFAHHESRLYYPYGIAGSLVCFGSIIIMLLFFYERKINSRRNAEKEKDAEKSEPLKSEKELQIEIEDAKNQGQQLPSKLWNGLVVFLSCAMVCFFCASEMTTFQYLPTFVVHLELGLSKFTGSFILSALAISFTVGRFSGILLAIKLNPEYILFLDWIIMILGNVILMFAVNSQALLWLGSIVLGFGFAAFFPAVFSFLKNRLNVTNFISAMLLLSSLAGNACGFPVLVGKFIETHPLILIYGNFFCCLIIGITFIGLTFIEFKYVRKMKK